MQCQGAADAAFKANLGGNTLPPRHADIQLRVATDGKDRCVSRQARRAGLSGTARRAFFFACRLLVRGHRTLK